jgi:hypothetical protein
MPLLLVSLSSGPRQLMAAMTSSRCRERKLGRGLFLFSGLNFQIRKLEPSLLLSFIQPGGITFNGPLWFKATHSWLWRFLRSTSELFNGSVCGLRACTYRVMCLILVQAHYMIMLLFVICNNKTRNYELVSSLCSSLSLFHVIWCLASGVI